MTNFNQELLVIADLEGTPEYLNCVGEFIEVFNDRIEALYKEVQVWLNCKNITKIPAIAAECDVRLAVINAAITENEQKRRLFMGIMFA